MNVQANEKQTKSDLVDIHSIFQTIQGEGPFCGVPSTFIRMAGCNLACEFCDTDYTSGRILRTVDEVVSDSIAKTDRKKNILFVVTGGEPFRQSSIVQLVCKLSRFGKVQIETNGTTPIHEDLIDKIKRGLLFVVVSPKTSKVHWTVRSYGYAWKYVARHDEISECDGLPVRSLGHPVHPILARPSPCSNIYLQPEDSGDYETNKKNIDAVVNSCIKFGHRLCLQVHKIIGIR